jgi:ABC-type transport system substrate-binding protein
MQDFHAVETGTTLAARKAAFGQAQQRAMDLVMAIPMGVIPQVSAVRSNVEHYIPYYNPRMYNVWLKN